MTKYNMRYNLLYFVCMVIKLFVL